MDIRCMSCLELIRNPRDNLYSGSRWRMDLRTHQYVMRLSADYRLLKWVVDRYSASRPSRDVIVGRCSDVTRIHSNTMTSAVDTALDEDYVEIERCLKIAQVSRWAFAIDYNTSGNIKHRRRQRSWCPSLCKQRYSIVILSVAIVGLL